MHHESAVTWQITRAQFDHLLINHAAEQGAVVHQGVLVKQVLFEGDQAVGVEVQMQDGTREKFLRRSWSMRPDRPRCFRTSFAGACAIRN